MKEKDEDICCQTTFIMAANSVIGMVRDNNEDNMQVSADLSVSPMSHTDNQLCELGMKGALMVVADGMGGMNAGEVASQIAVDTVKDCYAPEKITDEVVKTRYTIERFMDSVIAEADNRIKQTAKDNPATKGMGTTMVQAWIFDRYLYVSWAGDSRAYVFNPSKGLERLSRDHSLVQELVESGKISKEDAFDYPDSNVITNCLSAVSQKAVPESLKMPHELEKDDIILLCSDGLCGLIRDSEIQSVIANNQDDMEKCCEALIKAACDAGGHDNITVTLCKIVSVKNSGDEPISENTGRKTWIKWGVIALAAILIGLGAWIFSQKPKEEPSVVSENKDTIQNVINQQTEEKKQTGKEWKYVCKEDCSDNINAEIIKHKNLLIRVYFGNNKDAEFFFGSDNQEVTHFTENSNKDGYIEGPYNDKRTGRNYNVKFVASDFSQNIINGYFIIDKKDTVFLKNVPLTRPQIENSQNDTSTKRDTRGSDNIQDGIGKNGAFQSENSSEMVTGSTLTKLKTMEGEQQ
jgi:protein phosphatase